MALVAPHMSHSLQMCGMADDELMELAEMEDLLGPYLLEGTEQEPWADDMLLDIPCHAEPTLMPEAAPLRSYAGTSSLIMSQPDAETLPLSACPPPAPPAPTPSPGELLQATQMHPLYPKLLDANTACRKAGADSADELNVLDQRCRRAKAEWTASRAMYIQEHGALPPAVHDPFLTEYLEQYILIAQQHSMQLSALHLNARESTQEMAENASNLLSNPDTYFGVAAKQRAMWGGPGGSASHSVGEGHNGGSLPEQAQALRTVLKRQYADQIANLQEVFRHKRSKGKLPGKSTIVLKEWWDEHDDWPYPKEEDKVELSKQSGLTAVQVNNWFVNQRKRHWMRQFEVQPANEAEARQMLRELRRT